MTANIRATEPFIEHITFELLKAERRFYKCQDWKRRIEQRIGSKQVWDIIYINIYYTNHTCITFQNIKCE